MYYYENSFFPRNTPFSQGYPRTLIYPRFNKLSQRNPTINLSKIIDTTQRGINTINQIVPLYKQVTPIINQATKFTKSISSFLFNRNQKRNQNNDINKETNRNNNQEDYRVQDNENNPFFK